MDSNNQKPQPKRKPFFQVVDENFSEIIRNYGFYYHDHDCEDLRSISYQMTVKDLDYILELSWSGQNMHEFNRAEDPETKIPIYVKIWKFRRDLNIYKDPEIKREVLFTGRIYFNEMTFNKQFIEGLFNSWNLGSIHTVLIDLIEETDKILKAKNYSTVDELKEVLKDLRSQLEKCNGSFFHLIED